MNMYLCMYTYIYIYIYIYICICSKSRRGQDAPRRLAWTRDPHFESLRAEFVRIDPAPPTRLLAFGAPGTLGVRIRLPSVVSQVETRDDVAASAASQRPGRYERRSLRMRRRARVFSSAPGAPQHPVRHAEDARDAEDPRLAHGQPEVAGQRRRARNLLLL